MKRFKISIQDVEFLGRRMYERQPKGYLKKAREEVEREASEEELEENPKQSMLRKVLRAEKNGLKRLSQKYDRKK